MKKFLTFAFGFFLFLNLSFLHCVFANEPDEIPSLDYMPSDEEIMETIKSYHFDSKREQAVFKETKKRLWQIYVKNKENNKETEKDKN